MAKPPVAPKPKAAPAPKAPKAKAAPTKPKTGMAGLYGGIGPTAYVNQLYAPQAQQLASQQNARQQALHGMVSDFLNSLKGVSADLAPYTASANQQTADAQASAAALKAANPDAVTQADLAAVNAPQSQRAAVAGQNQTAFGGNAALLGYTGGVLPSDVFRADAAGRASYLNALPAIVADTGVRGLNGLANLASNENMQLASQKANSLQQARSNLASYVQNNQKLKLSAQNQAFNQGATTTRLNQAQDRLDLSAQVDQFNQKYKLAGLQLQGQRLGLSAQKFARQVVTQDRSYALSLKSLGLRQAAAQRAAVAAEYKLKSGGFTPIQVNKFKASAFNIANTAFNPNGATYTSGPKKGKPLPALTYQQAVKELRSAGVPLSIGLPALDNLYKPGVRGRPLVNNGTTSFDFGGSPGQLTNPFTVSPGAKLAGPQLSQLAAQAIRIAAPQFATNGNVQALVGRIMQESGGNPRAINLWDSNAKAGTPSKGILQTIDSTFNSYKLPGHGDIWNPLDNAIAAVRYMVSRYGHIVGPSNTGY